METLAPQTVNQVVGEEAREQLKDLFGNYRAEWLRDRIFALFTKPAYFPELEIRGPCVLIGGRGTGKTTVLKTLSYQGQFELSKRNEAAISTWPYYGFYYRVDTNHVRAFAGPELREDTWIRVFGHYINVLLCEQVLTFLNWYSDRFPSAPTLPVLACRHVGIALHLGEPKTLPELTCLLEESKLRFEAFINNLNESRLPPLSLQGAPVAELINRVAELPQFRDKYFFFLIDEYENFSDNQQTVVNTLIKHSGEKYSFKIGVRELGLRVRATLNPHEQLISPADYVRVDIAEKLAGRTFERFALDICNQRISHLQLADHRSLPSIEQLFPGLTDDEEAERLGVKKVISERTRGLKLPDVSSIPPLELYFCIFWAKAQNVSIPDVLRERANYSEAWITRYNNYKFALLFTIRRALPGIRKYFCGWRDFIQLSGSNIRYLLELVDQTLFLFLQDGAGTFGAPVPPEIQTHAAELVGKKNVTELEGLSVKGAQLTKLVLGLGRIFEVMARQLEGHTAEVNQFAFSDPDKPISIEFEELIKSAVMHLALLRTAATKRGDVSDVKSFDYYLHPIFAPFFVFSHRKKRKMRISQEQVLGLVGSTARQTIAAILKENGREEESYLLPEQLLLFGQYYGLDS